jgi:hypothetical protein
MPTDRFLGENHGAVHGDLEDAARSFHQAHLGFGECLLQLGGQTGRPGLIVSDDAEFDDNSHGGHPLMRLETGWGES